MNALSSKVGEKTKGPIRKCAPINWSN